MRFLYLLLLLVTTNAFATRQETISADCLKIQDGVCITKAELGNVSGSTSNIQTQINANTTSLAGKQATITGAATTITTTDLSGSKVMVTDGLGKAAASSTVDTTELGYIDGVTSNVQSQLNTKQATITGAATTITTTDLSASKAMVTDGSGKAAASATVDTTELGYLDGVTSPLQTQITGKADDSLVVHKSGTETVTGDKTFSGRLASSSTTFGNKPCPDMTDTQMLAIASPNNGDCVFNTTKKSAYFYDSLGTKWKLTGGSANGDVETSLVQDFENASLTDFTTTGGGGVTVLTLSTGGSMHGDVAALLKHATSATTNTFKQTFALDPKFRGKNISMKFECTSTASYGNTTVTVRDETNATDLVPSEVISCPDPNSTTYTGSDSYILTFDVPKTTASLSYKFTGAPEAVDGFAKPRAETIDDIVFYVTKLSRLDASITVPKPVKNEFSAKISSAGAVSDENSEFLSGNCSIVSSRYVCPFSITLTAIPNCTVTNNYKVNFTRTPEIYNPTTTSSQVTFQLRDSSNALVNDTDVTIACEKTGTDYIDPTTSTQSKTIPLTQSAFVQDADSIVRYSGAVRGTTNTAVYNYTSSPITAKGSNIVFSASTTLGATFAVVNDAFCSVTASAPSASSTSAVGIGISLNQTSGFTTSVYSLTPDILLNIGRDTDVQAGAGKFPNASWSGPVTGGSVFRIVGDPADVGLATNATVTVACAGSLRQANINKNSKVKIPTSELRFEGSSSRGSTDTGIVKFDAIVKLVGDAYDINPNGLDTTFGTHVKMKKAGYLCAQTSIYNSGASAGEIVITKNMAARTTPINWVSLEAFGSAVYTGTASGAAPPSSGCGMVVAGDTLRVASLLTPTSNQINFFHLTFFETDIQVSVSNTIPVYTDSDLVVKAAGNSAQAITAAVTDIPFTTVSDSTGGAWNGSAFTVNQTGTFTIAGSLGFSASAIRQPQLYVNGVLYKYIGPGPSDAFHPFSITDNFTAGQVLSIRAGGNGGTLSNTTTFHHISISKTGKTSGSNDVTPFVNFPQANITPWTNYGPMTIKGSTTDPVKGTTDVDNVRCRQVGEDYECEYSYNQTALGSSASGSGEYIFSLPSGISIDSSRVTYLSGLLGNADTSLTQKSVIPTNGKISSSTNRGDVTAFAYSSTQFKLQVSVAYTSYGAQSASLYALNNATIGWKFTIKFPGQGLSVTSVNAVAPPETFSTDTANLQWAADTTYTLTTLANAPKGTFITWKFATGFFNVTQCTTADLAPSQSTASMANNGIQIFGRAYNATASCGSPARIAIQIGKGHKGKLATFYKSTGKTTSGDFDWKTIDGTIAIGAFTFYDENNGILIIDAGFNWFSTTTSHTFTFSDGNQQANGYVVINTSKSPALAGVSAAQERFATLSHQVASGTAGGSAAATTTQTRTLNTIVDSTGIVTSLSSNQFVLPAGTYYMEGYSTAYTVDGNRARIRNITDGTTAILGSTEQAGAGTTGVETKSYISGEVIITSSKTFELQHFTTTAKATNGLGFPATSGENEVYAQLKITKVK